MIPLDTPPIIPSKDTLDLIVGPYGALVVLSFWASLVSFLVYKVLVKLGDAKDAIGSLHKEYSQKLETLSSEYNSKLLTIIQEQAKRDAEGIVASRELSSAMRAMGKPP